MGEVSLPKGKPKIKPIGTKILVLPDPAKETTIRGIIIPLSAASQLEEGTVILVSDEVRPYVQEDERIIYPRGSGVEHEYDGIKYRYLNGPTATSFGDVWAVI